MGKYWIENRKHFLVARQLSQKKMGKPPNFLNYNVLTFNSKCTEVINEQNNVKENGHK